MKKKLAAAIGAALVTTALLTGCSNRGDLADAAEARDQCHALDGEFITWQADAGYYIWECDLSDPPKEDR